jgi:hypothetical protein
MSGPTKFSMEVNTVEEMRTAFIEWLNVRRKAARAVANDPAGSERDQRFAVGEEFAYSQALEFWARIDVKPRNLLESN